MQRSASSRLTLLSSRMDSSTFRSVRVARARGQLREGFRYAMSVDDLRVPLALMAVVGTLSFNFVVLLPLLAERDLGDAAVERHGPDRHHDGGQTEAGHEGAVERAAGGSDQETDPEQHHWWSAGLGGEADREGGKRHDRGDR